MKRLNKLEINHEKLIKNEELLILKGGYGSGPCTCGCRNNLTGYIYGYLLSASGDCHADCRYAHGAIIGNSGLCEN